MSGAYAGFCEFVADVQRVLNIDGEAYGFALLTVPVPMADDVADQIGAVHPFGKLRLDIIADAGFNTFQIRLDRSKHASSDQIFLFDELGDLRALDDDIEDAAQPTAVTAAWCGGQSYQHRLRIGVDDLAVGTGRAMVGLVDDEQVCRWQLHAIGPHSAGPEGLDRRDLHRLSLPAHKTGLDDAVVVVVLE